ncbi:MAG: thrombospondin type 3 repeat-containing protein, partial [Pseudomonadota bacterium]
MEQHKIASLSLIISALSAGVALAGDLDGDGVSDEEDNCALVANARQSDSDGDRIGNACDADFNNDCAVTSQDFLIFRDALGDTS